MKQLQNEEGETKTGCFSEPSSDPNLVCPKCGARLEIEGDDVYCPRCGYRSTLTNY